MRASRRAGRPRGQVVAALAVLLVAVGGGVALERGIGARQPAPATPGTAPSGSWLCPHGGGPTRWRARLFVANPGDAPVSVRVTPLSAARPRPPRHVVVQAGTEAIVDVPARGREAASFVEFFGGWVAAGWVTQGGGGEVGVGAEPCAPAGDLAWFAPDGDTEQREDAYLVIMNPYADEAVFDVVLLTQGRAPIRASELTDRVLPPRRSVALRLNEFAQGELALGAQVNVLVGRVAVSSLGISREGGVRSALGATSAGARVHLPAGAGAGQSSLVVLAPGEGETRFAATLLSREPPQPAGGLTDASQPGTSSKAYPVTTQGPSSIEVVARQEADLVAVQRATGVGNDSAATGGAVAPATGWIVLPSVAGEPAEPGLLLVNPTNEPASVTLHVLAPSGESAPPDMTVRVAPGSVTVAPQDLLDAVTDAAVLVQAEPGAVVALGASTSLGVRGRSTYALSAGVPIPP